MNKLRDCPTCDGLGETMFAVYEADMHREKWESCPDCEGTGKVEDDDSDMEDSS